LSSRLPNCTARPKSSPAKSEAALRRLAFILLPLVFMGSVASAGSKGVPGFTKFGELRRPTDYRDWAFVTSGLGMTYGPAHDLSPVDPLFDNVFVNRVAYREFLRAGKWPEGTVFILEVRRAQTKVSINNGGRTQGEIVAIEASVKDRKRYPPDGWGYFSFDGNKGLADSAAPFPTTKSCYACHRDKAAADNTFVQFYPTLLEAAKKHGTLERGYDAKAE
jgi:hypothetical protein